MPRRVTPEKRGPSWSVRLTDPRTGKRFRKTLGPHSGPGALTLKQARDLVVMAQVALMKRQHGADRTMGGFLDEWLPLHAKRTVAAYHAQVHGTCQHAAEHFGRRVMRKINVVDAETYALGLLSKRKPSSVRQRVGVLVACWNAAAERGYVDLNPWTIVRKSKLPKVELRVVYVLSLVERHKILASLPEMYRPFVTLIDEMGLRRNEAESLVWHDYRPPHLTLRRTKTRKARSIRLTARAAEVLDALQAVRIPSMSGEDRVFGCSAERAGRAFKEAATALKLPLRGLHDLRHNVATRAAMGGSTTYEIAKLLGNSPQVCERYMDHAPNVGADRAVDALESVRGRVHDSRSR